MIKGQRRSRQLAMSRNRMMAAIVDADVVLVNPTHFAIALGYEPGDRPQVVARRVQERDRAAHPRERGRDHDRVPIVGTSPRTRALHSACDLGDEIPVDFLAWLRLSPEVLAFDARALRRRESSKG
jgi:flagellar biosynthetic protein FlhB